MKSPSFNSHGGGCIFKLVKLGILAVVILLVAAYFSLGYIADYALGVLTRGTGVDAGVGHVSVSAFKQKLEVSDFFITNPPGYPEGNAFSFSNAVIQTNINPVTLMSQRLIVIDNIDVSGLNLNMSIKTGKGISALLSSPESNIGDIAKIFEKQAADEKSEQQPQSSDAEPAKDSAPWKIIIKRLSFSDGNASSSINGKAMQVSLPSFVMENLGVNEGGLSPAELAMQIVGKLAAKGTVDIIKSATKEGANMGADAAEGTTDAVSKGVSAAEKALKSLFK